jgi:hypothetical protein
VEEMKAGILIKNIKTQNYKELKIKLKKLSQNKNKNGGSAECKAIVLSCSICGNCSNLNGTVLSIDVIMAV